MFDSRDPVSTHSKSMFSNFIRAEAVIQPHNVPVPSVVPSQTSLIRSELHRTFCVLALFLYVLVLSVFISRWETVSPAQNS